MTIHLIYLCKVPHKQCVKFDYILMQQNWVKVTNDNSIYFVQGLVS